MSTRYPGESGMLLARGRSSRGGFGSSLLPGWPWRAVKAPCPAACGLCRPCRPAQFLWRCKLPASETRKPESCRAREREAFSVAVKGRVGMLTNAACTDRTPTGLEQRGRADCMSHPGGRVPDSVTALTLQKSKPRSDPRLKHIKAPSAFNAQTFNVLLLYPNNRTRAKQNGAVSAKPRTFQHLAGVGGAV